MVSLLFRWDMGLKVKFHQELYFSYNRSMAWDKYYKGDKIRRRYEDEQREEYVAK